MHILPLLSTTVYNYAHLVTAEHQCAYAHLVTADLAIAKL